MQGSCVSVYVGWVGGDGGTAHAHRDFRTYILRFYEKDGPWV